MVPILYRSNETEFVSNGYGRLKDAVSCMVTEERNGEYELTMEYPVAGRHYQELLDGRIIYAIHDDTKIPQPFEIYRISKPINGVATYSARHVSYRLSGYVLPPMEAGTCAECMAKFGTSLLPGDGRYSFWTDKTVTATFRTTVPVSARAALGGMSGSVLDVYGKGEYEWDHYTVRLHLNRGEDTGQMIRFGKNLSDIQAVTDRSDILTGVMPYWTDSETGETVVGGTVCSSAVPAEDQPLWTEARETVITQDGQEVTVEIRQPSAVRPLDFSDKFDAAPTAAQLEAMAGSYITAHAVLSASRTLKVNFVQLWQTDDYAAVAPLQRLRLCDRVDVYHPDLGVLAQGIQIVKTVYNVLLERYDRMELGDATSKLGEELTNGFKSEILKTVPTKSMMSAAIDTATKLIRGGLGGHVVIGTNSAGQPNEILVMDTEDASTAVNVLRINMNGIGFSTSGYNGPYSTAWTLDGGFVADFITSGTLNANLLKAGVIMDAAGKNYWNLQTGEISIDMSAIESAGVTQADLTRTVAAMRQYTDTELGDAIRGIEAELEGYTTTEELAARISATREELASTFSGIYVSKGDALADTTIEYYLSTSPVTLSGGSWSTAAPQWTSGRYMWQRITTTKADGTTAASVTCIAGAKGDKGSPGEDGDDGSDALIPYIISNKGTDVSRDESETVLLTGIIADSTGLDTDMAGTQYSYLWWISRDSGSEEYIGRGKTLGITIDGNLCDRHAGLWFTTDAADLLTEDMDQMLSEAVAVLSVE